jgi:hypothetical protein
MPQFRGDNPRRTCQPYKWNKELNIAEPDKICSYFSTDTSGHIGPVFSCGRPEDMPCHPLYNKVSEEDKVAHRKNMERYRRGVF